MLKTDAIPTSGPAVRHANIHVLVIAALTRRLLRGPRLLQGLLDEPFLVLLLRGSGLELQVLRGEPAGLCFPETKVRRVRSGELRLRWIVVVVAVVVIQDGGGVAGTGAVVRRRVVNHHCGDPGAVARRVAGAAIFGAHGQGVVGAMLAGEARRRSISEALWRAWCRRSEGRGVEGKEGENGAEVGGRGEMHGGGRSWR